MAGTSRARGGGALEGVVSRDVGICGGVIISSGRRC